MPEQAIPLTDLGQHRPWALALAGLGLMLGGYALLNFTPAGTRTVADDPNLQRLQEMAAKDPAQRALAERLRELEHQRPTDRLAPLRPAGSVAFYAGLLLFIAAGIRMYRQPPAPAPGEDDDLENPPV